MPGSSDQQNPPINRDCRTCGAKDGLRLQNVARTTPIAIPLLYICERCGTSLTIPPPPRRVPSL